MTMEPLPGNRRLLDRLDGIDERSHDLIPAFLAIADAFKVTEAHRFENNGPGWLPLAASTMAATGSWARSNPNPDEILQDTGALLGSLQGGPGWYTLTSATMIEMGTRVPYAHWHQTGGTTPGRPPQRKIVALDEKDAVEWSRILAAWLFTGVPSAKGV